MSEDVTLTEQEMLWAAIVGVQRHAESVAKNRKDAHGKSADVSGLGLHIEGACGEFAVAKLRNRHWSGHVNSFKGADLGERTQVRTRSRHDYDLIVRDDDKDDHAFVHVTGTAPSFTVWGWMWGKDAKRDEFRKAYGDRPAAYFVPKEALREWRA